MSICSYNVGEYNSEGEGEVIQSPGRNSGDDRRTPRQERSRRRVATIIKATGELLEEVGYESLTTNAIARKAGTSIGSLYQFFPNKDAVIAELVKKFRNQINNFYEESLSVDLARRSITEFVEAVVDGLEAIRDRGFGSVFSFRRVGGAADDQKLRMDNDVMKPLGEFLAKAYPHVSKGKRQRFMLVVSETTKVLAGKAASENPKQKVVIRQEVKPMLGLYAASYFDSGGSLRGFSGEEAFPG